MTLAEIIALAKNDPELRKGLIAFSNETEEGKIILQNFADAEFDKRIKDKISEIHTAYDNDVFEILGERKEANVKSYDFIKKLVGELKELRGSNDSTKEAKIKELNDKIKKMQDDGSVNEHWKKIYEEALAKWQQSEKELKETISKKDSDYLQNQILNELNVVKSGLKFIEALPQEAVKALLDIETNKILSTAKIIDGKVVYLKEDGNPYLNKEYKPISAKELFEEKLSSIIVKDENASGGKAPKNVRVGEIIKTGEGDKAIEKLVLNKEAFNSKRSFNEVATKALKEQGVAMGDPRYNKLLDEAYKEYEVSQLEF